MHVMYNIRTVDPPENRRGFLIKEYYTDARDVAIRYHYCAHVVAGLFFPLSVSDIYRNVYGNTSARTCVAGETRGKGKTSEKKKKTI